MLENFRKNARGFFLAENLTNNSLSTITITFNRKTTNPSAHLVRAGRIVFQKQERR